MTPRSCRAAASAGPAEAAAACVHNQAVNQACVHNQAVNQACVHQQAVNQACVHNQAVNQACVHSFLPRPAPPASSQPWVPAHTACAPRQAPAQYARRQQAYWPPRSKITCRIASPRSPLSSRYAGGFTGRFDGCRSPVTKPAALAAAAATAASAGEPVSGKYESLRGRPGLRFGGVEPSDSSFSSRPCTHKHRTQGMRLLDRTVVCRETAYVSCMARCMLTGKCVPGCMGCGCMHGRTHG
eukprot:351879-Chlamydomonas_euryale.AAC.8